MSGPESYRTISVEHREGADWLTLNRPDRLNAFNADMIRELNDYFERLNRDETVRVVVMQGAGRAFCAGVDVKEINSLVANGVVPDTVGQRRISDLIVRMRRCPQPIIALLKGAATGGGFALAMAADIRVAGASARMNCAFIRLGLTSCDMGLSYMLPRIVGLSAASELMLTGRFIDAERALSLGLVSRLVDDADLEATAQEYLDDMLTTAPLGLRLTKDGLNHAVSAPSLEAAIAVEDRNQVMTLQTEDFREGLNAFFEKRPPVFAGR